MSLTVSILTVFILFLLIVIVFYNKLASLGRYLIEILNLSMFLDHESETALHSVFYLYDHNDIKSWQAWISNQDSQTQNAAVGTIMDHIYGQPGSWGVLSPVAIKSLTLFSDPEKNTNKASDLIDELAGILGICKRVWEKFIIAEKMYQATWETIIKLDEKTAIKLIKKELSNNLKDNDQINISLVSSFASFKRETNISELFCKVLTDLEENYSVKKQAMKIMEEHRDEEEVFNIINSTLTDLAKTCDKQPSDDDNKVLTRLLDIASNNMDDKVIKLILRICQNEFLSISCIKSLETIITNNPNLFEPKALYSLISIKNAEVHRIIKVLANTFHLNPAELQLCTQDLQATTDFKTTLFASEKLTGLTITDEMQPCFKDLEASIKNSNRPELPLLTGTGEKDKLYLARAFASQKEYSFLYAQYKDIASSEIALSNLFEKIQELKPVVFYLAEVGIILESGDKSLLNKIKKLSNDSRVIILASTVNENINIKADPKFKGSFAPNTFYLDTINMDDKVKIFKGKLTKIQQKNKSNDFDMEEVINSLAGDSRLNFEGDLIQYLKAGLLTEGKVIDLKQFSELQTTATKVGTVQ